MTKGLIFISTEPYSGKTGLAVNMVLELRKRGRRAGYFKPVGNLPVHVDSGLTDKDVLFAREILDLAEPNEALCPLILTSRATKMRIGGAGDGAAEKIKSAYEKVASGCDALILEGSGHINDGRLYHASAVELVEQLNLSAVLVVKLDNPYEIVDDVLTASDRLGDGLAGVVFNWVKPAQQQIISELVAPFLAEQGVTSFGIIPRDESLLSVSVDTLAKSLGGRILCAEDHLGDMVETFMVGAMGQEQALRFFRRKDKKAVITGGDRTDVQLAALETQTSCLVLTGNYTPPATVMSVAEFKGVPMILVDMDTLSAVERTESLIGHLRVHDRDKLKQMRERMEKFLDMDELCRAAGAL